MAAVRKAILARVAAWRAEGDDADARELLHDAFLHLRWRLDRGEALAGALAAMVKGQA